MKGNEVVNHSREHLDVNGRETRYGWISRKYSTALSNLAGNEVEITDNDGFSCEPNVYTTSAFLTVDDIIEIHDKMVDDFGGEYGIRDEGLLESLRDAPYTEFFGSAQYPGILDKAAKYLFDFTYYQVFVDGNKRVGLSLANVFLALNGLVMTLSSKEAYDLVMSIANHGFKDSSEIVPILEKNTKQI